MVATEDFPKGKTKNKQTKKHILGARQHGKKVKGQGMAGRQVGAQQLD